MRTCGVDREYQECRKPRKTGANPSFGSSLRIARILRQSAITCSARFFLYDLYAYTTYTSYYIRGKPEILQSAMVLH